MTDWSPRYVEREHQRHALALPAVVHLPEGSLRVETVNVSAGGAMIRLLTPVDISVLQAIEAVVIEGLGHFDCRIRWVSGQRFGLQFRDVERAETLLDSYLVRERFRRKRRIVGVHSRRAERNAPANAQRRDL